MSTPMDAGALLVWEGALVLGALACRAICIRLLDPDNIPVQLRKRVQIGTRLAPAVAALSMTMIAIGVIIGLVP